MKKWLSKGLEGSVTVESAMLMPFLFALIFLMLTLSISIYDRCMFDQESIRLEVLATTGKGFGPDLEEALREREETFPGEHLLLNSHGFQVEIIGDHVEMVREYGYVQPSNIIAAFRNMSVTGSGLKDEKKIRIFDPVNSIRNIRRLEKLKQVLEQAGESDE
ncbi:MAG: pilus assembly protein [Lachnospiraceae bacterium]|nr:pilus assembly protein [Lachnospiraceae bacterium]